LKYTSIFKILKPIIFLICFFPLIRLLWLAFKGGLGANPIEFITHTTGDWTLNLLLITLTITPFRKILHIPELIRFRRMLGLFAFFYGCLHFLTWCVLDKFFDFPEMGKDILKRPFITMGALGFGILIPLAITSTRGWIRRLGKRWQTLHRLIYVAAAAGVIHFYWLVKSDVRRPVLLGILLLALLSIRLWRGARVLFS
jgi:methionine sulfoxide reductase heme-binding subunit